MTSYSGRAQEKRSRNWVFTLPNYSQEDIDTFVNSTYKYIIFGKEISPTTGTPHLQGYVMFPNARRLNSLKTDFPMTTHWEIAKGTAEQNIEYCSKEGNFQEHGTRPDTSFRIRGWLQSFYDAAQNSELPSSLESIQDFILNVGVDIESFYEDFSGINIEELDTDIDSDNDDDIEMSPHGGEPCSKKLKK